MVPRPPLLLLSLLNGAGDWLTTMQYQILQYNVNHVMRAADEKQVTSL